MLRIYNDGHASHVVRIRGRPSHKLDCASRIIIFKFNHFVSLVGWTFATFPAVFVDGFSPVLSRRWQYFHSIMPSEASDHTCLLVRTAPGLFPAGASVSRTQRPPSLPDLLFRTPSPSIFSSSHYRAFTGYFRSHLCGFQTTWSKYLF